MSEVTPDKVAQRVWPDDAKGWLDIVLRIGVFVGLWWIFNEGEAGSWALGVPFAIAAVFISIFIMPPGQWHIHPIGTLRYVIYFLIKSVLSSIDVSRRVFDPAMPLKPGIIRYPFRLKTENPRVIVANTASLLPGTLSTELEGDELVIHALDLDLPLMEELATLELRVAGMYGIDLEDPT